jgi:hypothetical protein
MGGAGTFVSNLRFEISVCSGGGYCETIVKRVLIDGRAEV